MDFLDLKEKVVAEIKKTTFGSVTDTDHPAAWWATSFAGALRNQQSDTLFDLLKRVEAVFEAAPTQRAADASPGDVSPNFDINADFRVESDPDL